MSVNKGLGWTFDTDAENYERMRPNYPEELYSDIFEYIPLNKSSRAVEVGIGGGEATQPILKTGCEVTAVELGKNFTQFCRKKFSDFKNFTAVNLKYEDFLCEKNSYDFVYSASAFHWIPEEIGYKKTFNILKSGGAFARFANHPYMDKKRFKLCNAIEELYSIYMPGSAAPSEYNDKNANDRADIALKYGFKDIRYKLYYRTRTFTAKEYTLLLSTYSDHSVLEKEEKNNFFFEIENAIEKFGGKITLYDTIDLQLARKP